MTLHRYELDVGLDDPRPRRATGDAGWDQPRGAFGHALSLPEYRSCIRSGAIATRTSRHGSFALSRITPRALRRPALQKVSFRLLRRGAGLGVRLAHGPLEGAGVVRFQVPILSDPGSVPGAHRLHERGPADRLAHPDDGGVRRLRGGERGPLRDASLRSRVAPLTSTRPSSTRAPNPGPSTGSRSPSTLSRTTGTCFRNLARPGAADRRRSASGPLRYVSRSRARASIRCGTACAGFGRRGAHPEPADGRGRRGTRARGARFGRALGVHAGARPGRADRRAAALAPAVVPRRCSASRSDAILDAWGWPRSIAPSSSSGCCTRTSTASTRTGAACCRSISGCGPRAG